MVGMAGLGLVVLGSGAAFADGPDPLGSLTGQGGDPAGQLTGQLTDVITQVQKAASGNPSAPAVPSGSTGSAGSGTSPSTDPPKPSSDDDSPGHETTDPKRPDHGAASTGQVAAGGNEVAQVGGDEATTRDDDSTHSDSTLLALGGQEVAGAHADSRKGSQHSSFGNPTAPLCQASSGQVCLSVLYADADATEAGKASNSSARSGIASTCIGGTATDQSARCDGPIALGAATSSASSHRNQHNGRTSASSQSDLATVCLTAPSGGLPSLPGAPTLPGLPGLPSGGTTGCALGADALHSQGHADSGKQGTEPSADRDSYLLGVQANGKDQGRIDQPTALAIQPGCVSPSALCGYLNQGETYLGKHLAGTSQDGLDATLLPGQPVQVSTGLAHTETLVHNDGGEQPPTDQGQSAGQHPGVGSGGPGAPGATAATVLGEQLSAGGVLPNTGGIWSGLLALGLLALGAGCFLVASSCHKGRRVPQPAHARR